MNFRCVCSCFIPFFTFRFSSLEFLIAKLTERRYDGGYAMLHVTCYTIVQHYELIKKKKQNLHQFLDEHIQAHVYECVSHTVYVRMVVAGARFFLFYFASFLFNLFLHLKSSGLLSIFH